MDRGPGTGRLNLWPPPPAETGDILNITLIGQGGAPTQRQMAALGELLHQLEALSGHLILPEVALPEALPVLAARPAVPR